MTAPSIAEKDAKYNKIKDECVSCFENYKLDLTSK